LIGPEGGFTDGEVTAARAQGWAPVSFNGDTMRAETAAVVACAILGTEM
jgi:16S rRNA (uracil1498-N3)-methyltransferase